MSHKIQGTEKKIERETSGEQPGRKGREGREGRKRRKSRNWGQRAKNEKGRRGEGEREKGEGEEGRGGGDSEECSSMGERRAHFAVGAILAQDRLWAPRQRSGNVFIGRVVLPWWRPLTLVGEYRGVVHGSGVQHETAVSVVTHLEVVRCAQLAGYRRRLQSGDILL